MLWCVHIINGNNPIHGMCKSCIEGHNMDMGHESNEIDNLYVNYCFKTPVSIAHRATAPLTSERKQWCTGATNAIQIIILFTTQNISDRFDFKIMCKYQFSDNDHKNTWIVLGDNLLRSHDYRSNV